jgi:hypothetical protein
MTTWRTSDYIISVSCSDNDHLGTSLTKKNDVTENVTMFIVRQNLSSSRLFVLLLWKQEPYATLAKFYLSKRLLVCVASNTISAFLCPFLKEVVLCSLESRLDFFMVASLWRSDYRTWPLLSLVFCGFYFATGITLNCFVWFFFSFCKIDVVAVCSLTNCDCVLAVDLFCVFFSIIIIWQSAFVCFVGLYVQRNWCLHA